MAPTPFFLQSIKKKLVSQEESGFLSKKGDILVAMKISWKHFFLCILLPFFLIFSCGKPSTSQQKMLKLGLNSHPMTLDPRKSGDFISSTLICMLYEGLTRCLPGEEVELALAEKVEISEEDTVYTFFLKEAFWSDGTPVTAYDFERSWKTILNPEFPSFAPFLLYPIKNGEKYAKKEAMEEEVGLFALDAKTLRVVLERPTPHFLSLTAFPLLLPAPSHVQDVERGAVVSGPFLLEKSKINSEILLKKNPTFWNAQNVELDAIKVQIISDETTALELFQKKEIDYIGSPLLPLPPDIFPLFEKEKEKIRFVSMDASTFIAFNTESFPFSNVHLRRAFSLAIDRERIAKELMGFSQMAAARALPPSLAKNFSSLHILTDKSRALSELDIALSELGITKRDLSTVTLYFKTGQVDKRLAQSLEKEWEDTLGVSIEIKQVDPTSLMEKLHKKAFTLALSAWIAHFHDPINLLERYKDPQNPKNYACWNNSQFQDLILKSCEERNPQARLSFLDRAESILLEELPIAPLYHWATPCLVQPYVKNLGFTASGGILFERCFTESH